jgi:hypothetical protein
VRPKIVLRRGVQNLWTCIYNAPKGRSGLPIYLIAVFVILPILLIYSGSNAQTASYYIGNTDTTRLQARFFVKAIVFTGLLVTYSLIAFRGTWRYFLDKRKWRKYVGLLMVMIQMPILLLAFAENIRIAYLLFFSILADF